jgi:hypothetical protein
MTKTAKNHTTRQCGSSARKRGLKRARLGSSIWRGGQPGGTVWRLTLIQLREQLIEHGRVTANEVDAIIDLCDDPELAFMSQATIAAWGYRPR